MSEIKRKGGRPRLFLLNGPTLNLLGSREPEIYGRETLADIERICRLDAESAGLELVFRQSNAEHELVEWIHEAGREAAAIVINPAALSHYSYAIVDALRACTGPVIEVHISQIQGRAENWRQHSVVSAVVTGTISGLGANGYRLAIRHLAGLAQEPADAEGQAA